MGRFTGNVDVQTARIVEARVTEGDAAQRAQSLRLKSIACGRGAFRRGRSTYGVAQAKTITGTPLNEPLRLRKNYPAPAFARPPG